MKRFRFISVGVAVVAAVVLGSLVLYRPVVVRAVQTIVTTVTDEILPAPPPSPDPTPADSSPPPPTSPISVPTIVPVPSAPPTEEPFPTNPPKPTILPGVVQPTLVPVPQTNIFIGVSAINGNNPDTDEYRNSAGGYKCSAPCSVTYWCEFQGGFPGVVPIITWDGTAERSGCSQTGATSYTVTYTAGSFRATVTASEVYQGHTYKIGNANSVPITVS